METKSESEGSLINRYTSYLEHSIYADSYSDFDDPSFLQKLSLLQAKSFKDMVQSGIDSSLYLGEQAINDNRESINRAASIIADSLEINQKKITSSIERGFETSNAFLAGIQQNASLANVFLEGIEKATDSNGQSLIRIIDNQKALSHQLSYEFIRVGSSLSKIEDVLDRIYEELRIPETQREIRFHLEQGIKYLSYAVNNKDDSYFSDALDEFQDSVSVYKRDFVSWFYIGFIHTFSISQLNIEKAIEAYLHYQHNAAILPSKHYLWDDSCLLLAQCYYLNNDTQNAIHALGSDETDNQKIIVKRIKYLSLGDNSQKSQAAIITENLLTQCPYLITLLLSDHDVAQNDQIAITIDRLAKNKNDRAKQAFADNKNNYATLNDRVNNEVTRINDRIEKLDTHGRIELIDMNKWIVDCSDEFTTISNLIESHSFLDSQVSLDKSEEISKKILHCQQAFMKHLKGVQNRIPRFINVTKPHYLNAINNQKQELYTDLSILEATLPFISNAYVADIYRKIGVYERTNPSSSYCIESSLSSHFTSESDIEITKTAVIAHISMLKELIQIIDNLEWWQWDDFKNKEKNRLLELSAFFSNISTHFLVYTDPSDPRQHKEIPTLRLLIYRDFHIEKGQGIYSDLITFVEIPCRSGVVKDCYDFLSYYNSCVIASKWRPFMLSDEKDRRQEAQAMLSDNGHLFKAATDVLHSIKPFLENYGEEWKELLEEQWMKKKLKF